MATVAPIKPDNAYEQYLSRLAALATDAFKNHQLRSTGPGEGRWVIAGKNKDGSWCSFYLTEIIVGIQNTVITHGDIAPCLFKGYGPPGDPLAAVSWVARSNIVNYLEAKAASAFMERCQGLTTKFDADVAVWEIEQHIKERREEIDYDGIDVAADKQLAVWRQALCCLGEGWPWELVCSELDHDLNAAGVDDVAELLYDIGQVPAPRLFYAQAACQKLLELVEKQGDLEAV